MTQAEHADRIHRTLQSLHRALDVHHAALAAYAAEYGTQAQIDTSLVTTAAAPKSRPSNE